MTDYNPLVAQYPGKCTVCSGKIAPGQFIVRAGQQPGYKHFGSTTCQPVAAPVEQVSLVRFPRIVEMLTTAHVKGIKYPSIKLTGEWGTVKLALVMSGKNKGAVNVTDGKPYGQNQWYGRIYPDASVSITDETVFQLLKLVEYSPAEMIGRIGKAAGACCFCHKTITTDESLAVGYGPDCADHYGLPWGEKEVAAA